MPYLIDGHNLIPKLGLRLDALDDEELLIPRLQEFCRLRRAQVEVYFDGALPGNVSTREAGAVTVYFVRKGSSADAAIEARLARLGKTARNWIVVSSDRRVQGAAGAVHARVLSSEDFALEISKVEALRTSKSNHDAALAPDEVKEWLELFNRKRN
jgi:predicted RNA-binding protein with PIN domain